MEGVLAWSEFHLVDPFDATLVFFFAIIRPRRCVTKQSTPHYADNKVLHVHMGVTVTKQKSALHYENDNELFFQRLYLVKP